MNRQVPGDIRDYPFDPIVVGAGINGSGIAREAAVRDLKVLLLDKGDIAGGTTSRSGRLIHGGLRYLEHYEVALVRESLRDREILLRAATHLVKPLGFLAPIYEGAKYGPLMMRLGMIGYDLLSPDESEDNHRMLSRNEALAREPGLDPEGPKGAAFYYDARAEWDGTKRRPRRGRGRGAGSRRAPRLGRGPCQARGRGVSRVRVEVHAQGLAAEGVGRAQNR